MPPPATTPPPPPRGVLDIVSDGMISGWIMRPDRPSEPMAIRIRMNQAIIAELLADTYRNDLEAAGIGTGCYGFLLTGASAPLPPKAAWSPSRTSPPANSSSAATPDSLAMGVPCICSPIAAEGFDLPPPLQDLVAPDAPGLAAAILRLHHDPELFAACRQAGLAYITAAFNEATVDSGLRRAAGLSPPCPGT